MNPTFGVVLSDTNDPSLWRKGELFSNRVAAGGKGRKVVGYQVLHYYSPHSGCLLTGP